MDFTVNGKLYSVVRLLGKGKGGYSYLCNYENKPVVVKKIHHEPCSYYNFGNKIQAELNDYERLVKTGIRMPAMIDLDEENECVVKEYVEGDTVYELVKNDALPNDCLLQVKIMAEKARAFRLNIDYFPTNFVLKNGLIYYIDYECNEYSDEWNFENWGVKYWSKTPEFIDYMTKNGDKNGI